MTINKVFLTGRLTRDPETRATAGGSTILNMGIAVDERRKNQQTGEWESIPQFFDMTMFGRRAEAVSQYLHKGDKVSVEGRLHYSAWEDRNTGKKRSKVDVTVDEIEFMSQRQWHQQPMQQPQQQAPADAYYDDDVPF